MIVTWSRSANNNHILVPIPKLDRHVIGGTQNKRSVRMNLHKANVICVCLPFLHLLHSIVIIHAQLHIIRGGNYPLLSCNEFGASHRHLAQLKAFHKGLQDTLFHAKKIVYNALTLVE